MQKRRQVGDGWAVELADMDFETYSEAGYVWDDVAEKWKPLDGTKDKGMKAVGAAAYAEHPSTELRSLAYDLKDGLGARLWIPGMAPPLELFEHIWAGGLIEAHNSAFEFYIWKYVCHRRMGWPELPLRQLRCSAAKCRASAVPGALADAAKVLEVEQLKISDGKRLIQKFCCPRNPTKNDKRRRILPSDDYQDAARLYEYNIGDIVTEAQVSQKAPDLSETELELWLLDQKINTDGVAIDMDSVRSCICIVEQARDRYEAELYGITGGEVRRATESAKLRDWLYNTHGVRTANMQAATVTDLLKQELPAGARRALEIRSSLGASSVNKLYSLSRRVNSDNRIRDMFAYCGADRTGRFAGRGPQPQNLPNSGPKVRHCPTCLTYYDVGNCPNCGNVGEAQDWGIEAVEFTLGLIRKYPDLNSLLQYYTDPIAAVSGCLRGLFCASEGKDLLCSDYSAIEAVVLAALAGEEWRLEVFRTHGKIYEMSAAKISGVPFEEFKAYKDRTGDHHPLRKKIGKVAELASGYQGGLGAWKQFGADEHLSEQEIKDAVKAWRKESPNIVKFWYGIEDTVKAAITCPGQCYVFRGLTVGIKDDVLYIRLLSGRTLKYHKPRLEPVFKFGRQSMSITYMGWNNDYTKGPRGWTKLDTYGGKLTENITQATARDILTHAMTALESAGYPIVLHIHDEVVCGVPEGGGSIEELEDIMADLPEWCKGWPIKAAGGWRGKRYRKD